MCITDSLCCTPETYTTLSINYTPIKTYTHTHTHTHTHKATKLVCYKACMLSHFSHVWLCDPVNYSLPGPSVHGISQARMLEWVVVPSSKGSFWLRDWVHVSCSSCIGRQVLYPWAPGNTQYVLEGWAKIFENIQDYTYSCWFWMVERVSDVILVSETQV